MLPTKDLKKYLPSKQFTISLIIILMVFSFALLAKGLFSVIKNSIASKKSGDKTVEITIGEVVQQDSNKNGIPDWEEYIWGLNPTKNGPENKAFILAKKKTLTESGDIVPRNEETPISDNDALSRELLAVILSLSGSEQINDETVNSISEAIGQQLVVEEIPDKYTRDDLKIVVDTEDTIADYAANVILLYSIYEGADLGKEMTLISQGIANQNAIPLVAVRSMASSYRDLSNFMLLTEVPSTLYTNHLKIINNYEKLAQTIEGLSSSIVDPLIGLKSIILYSKINEEISYNMETLLKTFSSQLQ